MANPTSLMRIKRVFDNSGEQYLTEKNILDETGIARNTLISAAKTQYLRKVNAISVGVFLGVSNVYEWVGGDIVPVEVTKSSGTKTSVVSNNADVSRFLSQVEANPDALMSQIYNAASSAEKAKGVIGGLITLITALQQKQFESES